MIVVEGDVINNLEEAANWLREAWIYEPYNIWYEEYGDYKCINIEPNRGTTDRTCWYLFSLKEFEKFIS